MRVRVADPPELLPASALCWAINQALTCGRLTHGFRFLSSKPLPVFTYPDEVTGWCRLCVYLLVVRTPD